MKTALIIGTIDIILIISMILYFDSYSNSRIISEPPSGYVTTLTLGEHGIQSTINAKDLQGGLINDNTSNN